MRRGSRQTLLLRRLPLTRNSLARVSTSPRTRGEVRCGRGAARVEVGKDGLGGVDSKDSLLGANQIQDCFWGGSLGCDGPVGFERRGVGADGAADHRSA